MDEQPDAWLGLLHRENSRRRDNGYEIDSILRRVDRCIRC